MSTKIRKALITDPKGMKAREMFSQRIQRNYVKEAKPKNTDDDKMKSGK